MSSLAVKPLTCLMSPITDQRLGVIFNIFHRPVLVCLKNK